MNRFTNELSAIYVSSIWLLNDQFSKSFERLVVDMAVSGKREPLNVDGIATFQSDNFNADSREQNGKRTQIVIVAGSLTDDNDSIRIEALYNELLGRGAAPIVVQYDSDEQKEFEASTALYSTVDIILLDTPSLLYRNRLSDLKSFFLTAFNDHIRNGTLLVPDLEELTKMESFGSTRRFTPPNLVGVPDDAECSVDIITGGSSLIAMEAHYRSKISPSMSSTHLVSVIYDREAMISTDRLVRDSVIEYRTNQSDKETAELTIQMVKKLIDFPGYGNVHLRQSQVAKLIDCHESNFNKCISKPATLAPSSKLGITLMMLATRMHIDPENFFVSFPWSGIEKSKNREFPQWLEAKKTHVLLRRG